MKKLKQAAAIFIAASFITDSLAQVNSSAVSGQDPLATGIFVGIASLQDISISVKRSVPATAVSLRTAVVASELSAQVIDMPLSPGDLISQGDIIARLDCVDNELALKSSRSQIAALKARQKLARQQLKRLNKLQQSRNATEEQISQRQAELDIVNAEIGTQSIAINIAERQVGRCEIKAPFSGLVTTAPGKEGNYLVPGSSVISLVDIDMVELKASLLETQVKELQNNPPVFEFSGDSWPLTVRTIFPVIDEATQTREIRFRFLDNKPSPGTIGRLRWSLGGVTIPATYLVSRGDHNGIFIVDSKDAVTAKFLAIPNAKAGQPTTVKLDPTLLVVTDGRFGLQDGQEIRIEQ